MSDNPNGSGFLEVGTTETNDVVVNLPTDMTGHIVFSIEQARELARTLNEKANAAAAKRLVAEDALRIASIPPVDRTKICTTNGIAVEDVRANQTAETGQHSGYIVLCEDERKKGFVRPYRDAYKHVGRSQELVLDNGRPSHTVRVGGCGTVTTMGRALSETYARDPAFYSHTFCVSCNRHLPVSEFVWTADSRAVGS